jgi:lactoylglutathione lyase
MILIIKIVGFIAAFLTTSSFIPQAYKTWKTKSTDDLSPIMFILFCLGILLWLFYGIAHHDLPMILANSITICLAGIILFYILRPVKSRKIVHIAIWVNNLEAMKHFYLTHFDTKAGNIYTNASTGFSSCFISFSGGVRLELMHNASEKPAAGSWGHFAIYVGSRANVDSFTEELKNKGVNIIRMPRVTGDGYYESLIEDIEGNRVEITA